MSTRGLRALAFAAALAALACGGDETESAGEVDAAATAAAAPSSEAASPSPASDPAEPESGFATDDRVGEVLDTDPEGEGLDQLIRDAREDADPRVREAAVIALGDSDDTRALDALIAATEDSDTRVVLAAIDQLSWFDDRLAQDAIRRLVDSPIREIAEAAREELDE